MPKCAACPVPAGLDCPAITRGHRRYCELIAAGRADYAPVLVAMATEGDPALDPAEAIRLRRAAKPRIRLGEKPPTVRR